MQSADNWAIVSQALLGNRPNCPQKILYVASRAVATTARPIAGTGAPTLTALPETRKVFFGRSHRTAGGMRGPVTTEILADTFHSKEPPRLGRGAINGLIRPGRPVTSRPF